LSHAEQNDYMLSLANSSTVIPSDALKTSVRAFVKNKRTTSNLFAQEHLAQDDIVVARLVDRGDPATDVSRGALQQGQPVSAECYGKILNRFCWFPVKRADSSD
jgi:hypothetical protein